MKFCAVAGLLCSAAVFVTTLSLAAAGAAGTFRVRDFGAKGDGVTKDTAAVQAAVDAAAKAGGGTVELDAGTYVTGSLFLRSNVDFHVGPGATLKASGDRADYNAADVCVQNEAWAGENSSGAHLLLCLEQTNVVVRGEGTIDGNGARFTVDPQTGRAWPMGRIPWRPSQMLFFAECRNVRVEGLRLVNSPYWTCFFHGCDHVVARGLVVKTSRAPRTWNGDGIDVDCCRFVRISDCVIETDDDSITLRANPRKLKRKQDCAYVTVENSILSSLCNAVRLGVGNGTVRDAVFSNLVIRDTKTAVHFAPGYSRGHGTDIRNCRFSNLQVDCQRFCVANHQFSHEADVRDVFFNGVSGVQRDRSILWAVPEKPFGLFSFVDVNVNGGIEAVNAPKVVIDGGTFAQNGLSKDEYDKLSDDIAHERRLLW